VILLTLPPTVQIFFCVLPVDMRRSFDSLAEIVRAALGHDPMSGHLFVFRNKAEDCVKILYWDRDGYAIWYKRLQKGTFSLPAATASGIEIDSATFSMLLNGMDLQKMKRHKRYAKDAASV
jgi:transposase